MTEWRLGEFGLSYRVATQARAGFRELGDADGEMRSENVAAAGSFALGDLDGAERGFGAAFGIAVRLGDDLMVARSSNNLGNVAFYLGNHQQAHGFYRLARAGFERVAFDHGVAETWINTGLVWRDLNQMTEALGAANAALEVAERAGSKRIVAQAFSSRGEALAAVGDTLLGRAQVHRGLSLARAENDRLAEAEALRLLCNLERRSGSSDDALRFGREALDTVTWLKHPWATAEVQRDLGELYRELGRPSDAASAFRAAEAAFLQVGARTRAGQMEKKREELEADANY
jgi:tetratricopeptide (TPR) repeat protein